MNSKHFRASMHAEKLKIGRKPDPTKPTLKDRLMDPDVIREAEKERIEEVGLRLTYAQEKALTVVQQLLDETDFAGNARPRKFNQGKRYRVESTLPVLVVKTSEFLRRYGVRTARTRRAVEFSPQARRVAVNALKDLATERHLLVYEKSVKGKRVKSTVEALAPLIVLSWPTGGRTIEIVPNPILIDQVDSYYVLKPVDLFDRVGDKDPTKLRFLSLLCTTAAEIRRAKRSGKKVKWEIRLTPEVMAYTLRLNGMIERRKRSEVRQKVEEMYKAGVQLGLLSGYDLERPATKRRKVDVLKLNPKEFGFPVPKRARSTTKKRKI